jgi:hypothetical protein
MAFRTIWVEQPALSNDNMFLAFVEAICKTIPNAMRDIMTCEPSYIMMGMSAETFWGRPRRQCRIRGAPARLHRTYDGADQRSGGAEIVA